MKKPPSIIFDNVTIEYNLYDARSLSIRNKVIESMTGGRIHRGLHSSVITALKNANFILEAGDKVGLIGGNGAGKTTLLRAMAGIYPPAKGHVHIQGKVSTIIDIDAGMDEELSGIENIYRLSILKGASIHAIDKRIDEIESFTGLGEYLRMPVRSYSSGMKIRLMFAIATSMSPDILLIDEMFSVGDTDFQSKATVRIENNIEQANIFVFASHDLKLIRRYCKTIFKMEHGLITREHL